MPCIVCRKERWASLRLPLEMLSPRREKYLRENYFTNHEFDHICRFCSFKDQCQRLFVGACGFVFEFVLKAGMIAAAVFLAYGFCAKWGLPRPVALAGPFLFGLAFGGVLGLKFMRVLGMFASGVAIILMLFVVLSQASVISILPDVTAMSQREQLRQRGEIQWLDPQTGRPMPKTTTPFDPIKASEERDAKIRRDRLNFLLAGLKRAMPFKIDLDAKQTDEAGKVTLVTLGVFYVFGFLIDWWWGLELSEKKKKPGAKASAGGRR